jgi:hypothetical protein
VSVEDMLEDVPILAIHNHGFTGSFIVRTVSDTRIVYEQSLLKPYRMVVGKSLGASACGSLAATLSDLGIAWLADAHSHGVQRHIEPLPDMIIRYETKKDEWCGPVDPLEEKKKELAETDPDDVIAEEEQGGDDKADKSVQRWELAAPATYVYDGIFLDRTTVYLMYPNGTIRKIFLAETYEEEKKKSEKKSEKKSDTSFLPPPPPSSEKKKKKKKMGGKKK